MTLDDFLAKKEKKKPKKKKNALDLLDKLTKETEIIPSQEFGPAAEEAPKFSASQEKEDEWEPIDDDKEIDLENIRIGKLSIKLDGGAKSSSRTKECDNEPVEEKKVWAIKPPETPAKEPEEKAPEPSKPEIYVPAPLRALSAANQQKPNVSSLADFPTLDAALTPAAPPKKPEGPAESPNDPSWQQAAIRRSTRPNASNPSAYVPPALRQGSGGEIMWNSSFDSPAPKSGEGPRSTDANRWRNTENSFSVSSPSGGGWVRGDTIVSSNPTNTSSSKLPSQRKPITTDDGFIQNVRMKVCKSSIQEKPQFELIQSNRFAGLNEI